MVILKEPAFCVPLLRATIDVLTVHLFTPRDTRQDRVADVEGQPEIAALFRSVSEGGFVIQRPFIARLLSISDERENAMRLPSAIVAASLA